MQHIITFGDSRNASGSISVTESGDRYLPQLFAGSESIGAYFFTSRGNNYAFEHGAAVECRTGYGFDRCFKFNLLKLRTIVKRQIAYLVERGFNYNAFKLIAVLNALDASVRTGLPSINAGMMRL